MNQNTGLLSNYLEKLRIRQLIKILPDKSMRILDIGCGDSRIIELLDGKINGYIGVDLIAEQIKANQEKYPEFNFMNGDILNINLSGEYDLIILIAFIEHLSYEENIILFNKLKPYLAVDGSIILTTPAPSADLIHRLGAKIGLFSREAAQEHKCFFNNKLLQKLAYETGYKINIYRTFQFGLNQLVELKSINEKTNQ